MYAQLTPQHYIYVVLLYIYLNLHMRYPWKQFPSIVD